MEIVGKQNEGNINIATKVTIKRWPMKCWPVNLECLRVVRVRSIPPVDFYRAPVFKKQQCLFGQKE